MLKITILVVAALVALASAGENEICLNKKICKRICRQRGLDERGDAS